MNFAKFTGKHLFQTLFFNRLKPYLVAQYLINHENEAVHDEIKYAMENKTQMRQNRLIENNLLPNKV